MLEFVHGKLRRVLEEEGILLDAVGMESVKQIAPDAYNIRFRENKLGLLLRVSIKILAKKRCVLP